MRLLMVPLLVLMAACGPSRGGPLPGAPSARGALDGFLAAVRAQDLQAMSTFWGTAKGPARDQMDRAMLETRAITLQCLLAHERVRVLDEAPRAGGRRAFRIELTYGRVTKTTSAIAIEGPSDRWYLEDIDVRLTQALCEERNRATGRS